jgi:hypothetical protein
MERLTLAIEQAINDGVRIGDICEAVEIMAAVRTGNVSTLTVRKDVKDNQALWVKGSNYVKR